MDRDNRHSRSGMGVPADWRHTGVAEEDEMRWMRASEEAPITEQR